MPTYKQIANDWTLWREYVDPDGHWSYAEWSDLTELDRIAFIEACFGPE